MFSKSGLRLGRILWYLLKADKEMAASRYEKGNEDSAGFCKTELTQFGKEVGRDEIHWWVFKREKNTEELRERTERALTVGQRLKQGSSKLLASPPESYDGLIGVLKNFADAHSNEIEALHDYVAWLHSKDVLAPCILYSYRVWGTTRLSDRNELIEANTIDTEDVRKIERLAEIAFGLRQRGRYTLDTVRLEVAYETYEAYAGFDRDDMPNPGPVEISQRRVLLQTSYETLREFAVYFESIRNSLRNVLVDIEKYVEQRDLMKSDVFWQNFIMKAIESGKAEAQIWDFKKTLEMWHIGRGQEKAKAELGFSEAIASFANARGGVLIVGISDSPRKIKGIGNNITEIERRMNYTSRVIAEYINPIKDVVYFHQVPLQDGKGDRQICLVIAVAQADSLVSVKDKEGRYTYPVRRETGFDRVDITKLEYQKIHIKDSNFDFINELREFVYDK
jgi:hypothetical protein